MHAGSPDRSQRLKRTLDYIKSAASSGCTTAEIQGWTHSMAPATDVSELRQSGYLIECSQDPMRNGRRVYRYTYKGWNK